MRTCNTEINVMPINSKVVIVFLDVTIESDLYIVVRRGNWQEPSFSQTNTALRIYILANKVALLFNLLFICHLTFLYSMNNYSLNLLLHVFFFTSGNFEVISNSLAHNKCSNDNANTCSKVPVRNALAVGEKTQTV